MNVNRIGEGGLRNIDAQIDDLETGSFEHHRDNILDDIV